ncbi:MAG: hypothetical protein RL042_237 [Nitrospirota bacterium]
MLLDKREEGLHFLRCIHQFNDDREILRQPLNFEGVNDTGVGAKSHQATEDRGSCQSLRFRLGNDLFIERLTLISIALANENPK